MRGAGSRRHLHRLIQDMKTESLRTPFSCVAKVEEKRAQNWRATIIFLISAIALAGFRPFGQAFAQFMIVWQR
jgi:hypothetical protein